MANKKVLILSLGRGNEKDVNFKYASASETEKEEHLKQIIISKESAYKTANYVFENETEAETNVFIATSLLKKEKPDIVFVIGTPGSSWTSFYVNHKKSEDENLFSKVKLFFGKNDSSIDKQYELLRSVWDVEESNTNDAKGCEPLMQNVIEGLKDDFGVEKIKAIVLPTGKNKEELEWIYSHLNEMITSELNDDCTYDVAFDITHSFRSIPFYNYAILNYLKQVTDVNLNINKIYYGAFEAKYRLEDGKLVTPIVELDKVTNIMNLTNAVSSFNETGSIKGLIDLLKKIENKNDGMIDILFKLEWAIESNNGDAVYDCFVNMVKFINENNSDEINEYTDILNALKNALSIPYYGGKSLFDIKETNNPIEYSNNQLVLAKWYLSKHRYSQALCVACENFRSYLACLYGDDKVEYIKDENHRKNALDNFKRAIKYGNDIENVVFYKKILRFYDKAYKLRNASAHNLKEGKSTDNGDDVKNLDTINDYCVLLEQFANEMNNYKTLTNLTSICSKKYKAEEKDLVYLYLFSELTKPKKEFIKNRLKSNYIYVLPKELQVYLKDKTALEDKRIFDIGKYIQESFDIKKIQIFIDSNINKTTTERLCQLFDYLEIKNINSIADDVIQNRPFPKLLFEYKGTVYDDYEPKFKGLKPIKIDNNNLSVDTIKENEKLDSNLLLEANTLEDNSGVNDSLIVENVSNVDKEETSDSVKKESTSKVETKTSFQKKSTNINQIKSILGNKSINIDKKIDVIKNEAPRIIFENVKTNIPEKNHIDAIRLLINDLGFTDKRIIDCVHKDKLPRINIDYTLVIKTNPNNQKLENLIETTYGTIEGVKNVDDLKSFIKMIVYYWLIINEKDKREADNKMMNNYIRVFKNQIILMEGR